jgi:hypothetical protein
MRQPEFEQAYLDEVERALKCASRTCHGPVRIALNPRWQDGGICRRDGVKMLRQERLSPVLVRMRRRASANLCPAGLPRRQTSLRQRSPGADKWDAEIEAAPGVTMSPECKRVLFGAKQGVQKHFDLAGADGASA